jgi:hypothetical protein
MEKKPFQISFKISKGERGKGVYKLHEGLLKIIKYCFKLF